jgi:hypothetical protein
MFIVYIGIVMCIHIINSCKTVPHSHLLGLSFLCFASKKDTYLWPFLVYLVILLWWWLS